MTAAELVARLDAKPTGTRRWQARCPAHDDRDPSLSIAEAADGKVLLRCFAGCTFDSITQAIGIDARALMAKHSRRIVSSEYCESSE